MPSTCWISPARSRSSRRRPASTGAANPPAPRFSSWRPSAGGSPRPGPRVGARGGLRLQPGFGLEDHPPLDVLIVPGGVVDAEIERPEVMAWLQRVAPATSVTASVCTGAFLLGQAGLLPGKQATTPWEDLAELRRLVPGLGG